MSSVSGFVYGGPIGGPQGHLTTETKILMGVAFIGLVILVVYVAKKNMEKNKVAEECGNGILKERCLKALTDAAADTALAVAPLAACLPIPLTPACGTAVIHVYKSVNNK